MIIQRMYQPLHGVAPLANLGLIQAQGTDAAKFLHNQLTNDFALLGLSEARLAGFCSAKGRLQASFIGFKHSPTDILLVCSQDLLASTLKRLSMFVLRAQVKLTDATADFAVYGLAGDSLQAACPDSALANAPAWAKFDQDTTTLIKLYPADGTARALCLAPHQVAAPAGPALSSELWAWSEVRSGIATVTPPVVDAFVPQMLNYESVGGVNFKKGCYPGQEVVARSQFRGTLKRRAYLAHSAQPLPVGAELYQASGDGQPCGMVVQMAASPQGGFDAIVSIQISAFETGDVCLGHTGGALLHVSAAPYPLLADV